VLHKRQRKTKATVGGIKMEKKKGRIKEILDKIGFIVLSEFSRPSESKEEFDFNKFVVIARK